MIKISQISSEFDSPGSMMAWSAFLPKKQREYMQKQWSPGGDMYNMHNLGNVAVSRGAAKGVKETIPGLIDFFVGNSAGLVNGIGHLMSGGSYSEGYGGL